MNIKKIEPSKIKLDDADCRPGILHFAELMDGIKYWAVDVVTEAYWTNNSETAVFVVDKQNDFSTMVSLANAIAHLAPTECDTYRMKEGSVIFRLWWD